jgi:hypothetical protein
MEQESYLTKKYKLQKVKIPQELKALREEHNPTKRRLIETGRKMKLIEQEHMDKNAEQKNEEREMMQN